MTRRATIAINFDVQYPGHTQALAAYLRTDLDNSPLRNVEVTVLDDGAPQLPPQPAASTERNHRT